MPLAPLFALALASPGPVGVEADAPAGVEAALLEPLPAGTTLERVETHAEYVRYYLRAERAFVLEVTPDRDGQPVGPGGGAALGGRRDLWVDAARFVGARLPRVVAQAGARLADHPPTFAPEKPRGAEARADDAPPWEPLPEWRWRPLHAVVVPFLALLAWFLPRDRVAVAAGLGALAVRAALSAPTVLLGGDAAYERLLRARGLWDPDPYYGETWPALLGLAWRALGRPDHFVHAANIGFSALTVAWTVALARRAGLSGRGVAGAAVLLAAHPLAVAVAGMEDVFVLVGLLQVVAVASALGPPREAWLSALAIGLVAHLRPEQGAFALVPLGVLAWRRAWAPLVLALALCGWRWAEILASAGAVGTGAGILGWSRWADPRFLADLVAVGRHHPAVLLDPTRSPLALAVLVLLGALGARRDRRLAAPLAALLVPLLVVLPKTTPLADPVRFQLPGLAFAAVLAGAALAPLARPRLVAWGAALAASLWFARAPLDGRWAWAHEYTFLRAHLRDMPDDALVLYRPDQDPFRQFGRWADAVSPGRWRPLGSTPVVEGALYWRGFADAAAATWPPMPCAFEPLAVTAASSATDGWVVLPPGPLEIGLYRVGGCE